jgi:hypothetical protein
VPIMDQLPRGILAIAGDEGHAPAVAVLRVTRRKAVESIAAPKGHGPLTLQHFPCKLDASWDPRWGPRCRSWPPRAGTPSRLAAP